MVWKKKKIPSICRPYGFADGKNSRIPISLFKQSGETHIGLSIEEEETLQRLEDALAKARSEVEDKTRMIDNFHKELSKMQQGEEETPKEGMVGA